MVIDIGYIYRRILFFLLHWEQCGKENCMVDKMSDEETSCQSNKRGVPKRKVIKPTVRTGKTTTLNIVMVQRIECACALHNA